MNDSPIIVIQCAAGKQSRAGCLHLCNEQEVLFVANPANAPQDGPYAHAHPDDLADTGETWRKMLLRYNNLHKGVAGDNPFGAAARLAALTRTRSMPDWQKSTGRSASISCRLAGGLIRAEFLTPDYDVTFSNNAEPYKRRRKRDAYNDWRMLPDDTADPVVFFGGKSYIKLFCALTERVKGPRYVFFNSRNAPDAPGCHLRKFDTRTRTNWHYECARAFMDGRIGI